MTDNAPHCLYCAYNLTGLAEGTRCPECGMVSVPEALRKEVWGIVDSKRRRWALMAHPLAKHPPGWWWSLDRPGDVRWSISLLVRNLVLCLMIILSAFVAADSVVVEWRRLVEHYDQADPRAQTCCWYEDITLYGLLARVVALEHSASHRYTQSFNSMMRSARSPAMRRIVTCRVRWCWSFEILEGTAAVWVWLLLVWAYVAQVGLWTQIRQGMPDFARPPRTIIAAANVQSCKLIFMAILVTVACGVEVVSRWACDGQWSRGYALVVYGGVGGLALAAAAMWVGALRSDFTRQLIRSRIHAARIIVMYALAFPAVTTLAIVFAL